MSLGKGKVDVGIPWDEARSTGRGEDELSIPDGTTSSPPSCGLSTLRDRCHHGAGYVPQGVGLGVSRQMLHMPDSQLTPPHTCSQDDAFGLFSPDLHTLQPGWAAESHLAGGGGVQGTFPPPMSPPMGRDSSKLLRGGEAPGTLITRAPSLMGHPH